jgi:hypothetical protein
LFHQLKGEVGSAGEQPTSNKVDAITLNKKEAVFTQSLFYLVGSFMAKKTHSLDLFLKKIYHLIKLIR